MVMFRVPILLTLLLGSMIACRLSPDSGEPGARQEPTTLRIALFNVRELSAEKLAQVDSEGHGAHPQLLAAARIVQRVRPDVLVLNEIDLGPEGSLDVNARRFVDLYLRRGPTSLDFPHAFVAPTNTGVLSGLDLDGNGRVATDADRGTREFGGDCWGFGTYPGQYSMAVVSRLPLVVGEVRTFQKFPWRSLPGHHLPSGFYGEDVSCRLRLSSKSHWDLPVKVGESRVHLLVSHPTPPVFDGEEDRNGRRNFDEIRFWALYLAGDARLVDDRGQGGGASPSSPFVIVGDLNARPGSRQSRYDGQAAIEQLLRHPRVRDPGDVVTSQGARGDRPPGPPDHPERATADFGGGSRVDYVLPSTGLPIVGGGVFWPAEADDPDGHRWARDASDHRLVWVDVEVGR